VTKLETLYDQFTKAHDIAHQRLLATKAIYCLCGREFPEGKSARIPYGAVVYADNRCGHCKGEGV
jgi:hypothetical protein